MWLINTSTLVLEEKRQTEQTQYAILSHRWQDDETTFQGMKQSHADRKLSRGWSKLSAFCRLARDKGHKYAWADTCCINKDSMTELSEAINSMYQWYSDAVVCIAFLHDVGPNAKAFTEAEWFERGWTLQELIAAKSIEFYDQDWNYLGDKIELVEELSRRTTIPRSVLLDAKLVKKCSVAQRMAWAADRTTERIEDRAWSLLGLFGIRTMTPSYGGGEAAFLALQEEIIRKIADQSIFAWSMSSETQYSGPFATSPSAFKGCNIVQCYPCSEPFQIDNLGLSINLAIKPFSMNTYLCILMAHRLGAWQAILLTKIPGTEQYVRAQNRQQESLFAVSDVSSFQYRRLRVTMEATDTPPITHYGFWLRTINPPGVADCTVKIMSADGNDNQERIGIAENEYGTVGVLSIAPKDGKPSNRWSRIRWIKLGFNTDFEPTCLISNNVYRPHPHTLNFEETLASHKDSPLRSKFLSNDWIRGNEGQFPITENAWPKGYYLHTFKGNGEAISFTALNMQLSIKLLPDHDMSKCNQSSEHLSRKIWGVDITDTGGSPPERLHHANELEYVCDSVGAWLLGCCCVMGPLTDIRMRRIQTHGDYCC